MNTLYKSSIHNAQLSVASIWIESLCLVGFLSFFLFILYT